MSPNNIEPVIEERSTLLNPIDSWLIDALGGGSSTASKQIVNGRSALWVPAWLAAIKIISEDKAKLPIQIFKKTPNSQIEQPDNPLTYLLNVEPNEDMTAMSFWETLVSHALAWSGGYAEIVRDSSGRATALYPLDPTTVQPVRDALGKLVYRVQLQSSTSTFKPHSFVILQQKDIFHLHGLSFDGISGYDMANLAKEVIGNALSALKYSGAMYGNGCNMGGLITTPNTLDPKARENLRQQMANRYSGAENAHKLMVLEQGLTYERLALDPQKTMMIESLKFSVDDIARIFRIPAHFLNSMEHSTFSNIEAQSIEYQNHTLSGWCLRIEQEIKRKLLLPSEKTLEIKHSFADLLKGDMNSQADYYGKMFMNGFISQNEVARRCGLPQLGKDGDKFYRPSNVVPVDAPIAPPAPPQSAEIPPQSPPGAEKQRKAVNTHIRLLASTLKRSLRVEQEKVQRFSRSYGAETKISAFYKDHEQNKLQDIEEVLESFRENADLTFDAKTVAKNIITKHVQLSLKESFDLVKVDSWLGERADIFAQNEINNLLGESPNV